ncbi:hypothetical protein DU52_15590 [Methanosarcina mazei]|uniref:Metal-binding protein n=1 Tax=Methanosarcina mazei TaxID=2209 RepID=A0A0F8E6G2_METMZ|nr:DUF2227 family putative metal-binding protein [Methanosarcina mazei]KKG35361.1 hypothetical protein DU52_15590 [Methanosarcina mazei]
MNGKQHETLNLIALFPTLFLLGYYHAALTFSILFVLKWIWNTYYVTPDVDTHSRATKRLGLIGLIINKLFGHRKTLHNPFFWIVLFGIEYYFLGAWVLGGVFPVASHLVTDKL